MICGFFPVQRDAARLAASLTASRRLSASLPTALHGLDDKQNPDPWRVDPERRGMSHTTFGGGPHRCAGMHLARMEVIATLEEWFRRIPEFRLADGAQPIYHSGIVAAVDDVPLVWPVAN